MISDQEECEVRVQWRGQTVRKSEVPLGREFIENERIYQTSASPSTYEKIASRSRFRYGDTWYYKDSAGDALPLEPNQPFGRPYFVRGSRAFQGGERIMVLSVEERHEK